MTECKHWGTDGHVGEEHTCGCYSHYCYQEDRILSLSNICLDHSSKVTKELLW